MPDHKVLDKLDLVMHYIFQQTYRLQKLMRTVVDISRYRSERVKRCGTDIDRVSIHSGQATLVLLLCLVDSMYRGFCWKALATGA